MEREPGRESSGKAGKMALLTKLYAQGAYTDVARVVGYAGFPRDLLEETMKDLIERFGRPKIQEVLGELITLKFKGKEKRSGPQEDAEVHLKEEVRKLCWQLLGPPPEKKAEFEMNLAADPTTAQEPAATEPAPAKTPPRPRKARQKKLDAQVEPERVPAKRRENLPIMKQYREAKEMHPDMVLLFRIGDFYEAFDADAETLHKALGLTLTTQDQTVSMAGFPHHQLESYLHKLLKAGLRVAICDQVEDTVARVRREVKRVIVPGEDMDGREDSA